MDKKKILAMLIICYIGANSLTGCNWAAKHIGGEANIELPAGQKLVEATWKDDSLWCLTRPMREDEEPETWTLQEDSNYGVLEGTVTIKESK